LIPRLIDATSGSVLIDKHDVREYSPAALREQIGFVPQETFLFSLSLGENIALGVKDATDDEIRRAADIAGLSTDLDTFPEGLRTMVGERGITLSGGQKQRTAIARAVLRNPRILILDDALSSVDTLTEERILTALQDVMKGRTTILISHRVSTVRHADRIYVIEYGKVAEEGTHSELIGRGGYYADLYQKQLLEEELEAI
jgi:ATP-binding cassette subfamily B protein